MAFRPDGSLAAEMARLDALRHRDPESAANVIANGQLLVTYARDGRLRELQCAVAHLGDTRVLLFHSVRMFRAACDARRLDVLRFLLAHGFDLQHACMRDVLHRVIDGVTDDAAADAAQPLVRFLLDSVVDVNWQRQGDLFTALHVACRKHLYGLAYLLILYDADVNAIAANDEMPLASAELATASDPEAERQRALVALLVDCGARRSWRKKTPELHQRILSFSASTDMLWSCPVSGEDLADAFSHGIQLDTLP